MRNEIYHQYAHSPKLVGLIDGLAEGLSPQNSLKAFYDNVFNINSASGGGLDVWGDIFNIKRSLTLTLPNKSNYVTEIPQDIKLKLNNGKLTLKAGSKVYVPNGAGVFDTVTLPADKTATQTSNDTRLYFYNGSYIEKFPVTQCYSGSTAPSGQRYMFWYDTTNNVVKKTSDSGSTWESGWSLPFCIATASNGALTSIDQVFNGFGYIGSTVFALPKVKGLIPNGKNVDGSFKNIEYNNSKVRASTFTLSSYTGDYNLYLFENMAISNAIDYYDANENIMTRDSYQGSFICGSGQISQGKIESFTPKLTSPIINVEQQYTMTDDEYRLILKLAASKNISDATCANIYTVLSTVFSEFGNIYVSDLGEMHLRYSFEFLLSDTMYAILRQTRVVPRPAGVGIEIYEIPSRKIIGFNGQELETFDNGTFFQGVRE